MARSSQVETALFWAMMVAGAATLAPCLVLPAWLEYHAQRLRLAAAREVQAHEQARAAAVRKQVEHLHDDPAYLLRIAEHEFGQSLNLPDVRTIRIAPSPDAAPADGPPPPVTDGAADVLPELSAFVRQVLQRYPRVELFVSPTSRPILLAMGAGLLLAALLLLGSPAWRPPAAAPPPDDH